MSTAVPTNLSLSWQLVRRNILYQRKAWVAPVTSLAEPLFYLAAAVWGFSFILGQSPLREYADFAGPALLAATVMNGAIVECTNNVFYRWRLAKLYDSVICTAMSAEMIVLGDLIYGTIRGATYGAAFLLVLAPVAGIAAGPAIILLITMLPVAWMFSAIGLSIVAHVTHWRQLQLIQLAIFAMFLLADTFVSLSNFGPWANAAAHLLPLTYANTLSRTVAMQQWPDALLQLSLIIVISAAASALAIRSIARKMTE